MNVIKPGMYRIDTRPTQTRTPQLPQSFRNSNPRVSTSTGVIHNTSVSRPQLRSTQMKDKIVQIILFIVDSGCTKHMTGNLKLLCNFMEKDLEVAFRKSTCFVSDLQGNDLLTGTRGFELYTISLQEASSPALIYFMEKATPTQAWLWHRRLSHLNFNTINLLSKNDIVNGLPKLKYVKDQLYSSCELGKAKRSTFKTKIVPSSKRRLHLPHIDLCGPMQDETLELLNDFLKMIQRNLQAQVIIVHTDSGTEFLNNTLQAYFKEEGIDHQTLIVRTPRTALLKDGTENNNDPAENASFQAYEFINPFDPPGPEVVESSSCNVDTSHMHTFYQRHRFDYHWTKDRPLEQVRGDPSKPVQTR
ncbi:retrovirus-related pol polyprotein from transposon TNT 1-94 [Tanacetum coccineum]